MHPFQGSLSHRWRSAFLSDNCWFGVYSTLRAIDRVCYVSFLTVCYILLSLECFFNVVILIIIFFFVSLLIDREECEDTIGVSCELKGHLKSSFHSKVTSYARITYFIA